MKSIFVFLIWLSTCFPAFAWTHGTPPYTGLVATRGNVPSNFETSATTAMSRSMHFARTNVMSLQLVIPNFYVNVGATGEETGTGASTTITAGIEYPAGTCAQVKFSGTASGIIPNGGYLVSDKLTVAIPNGAQFWVRMHQSNAVGWLVDGSGNQGSTANGDLINDFQADITNSCGTAVSNQFAGYTFAPLAIVGSTSSPSIIGVGSSRMAGNQDTQDGSGDLGPLMRSIGPAYGYINLGVASDNYADFIASHTNRIAMFQYASTVVFECPVNDTQTPLSSLEALAQTMYGYATAAGKLVQAYTCDPSTSGAAVLANQSDQTVVTNYAPINGYIMGKPAPLSGVHDITAVTANGVNGQEYWNPSTGTACPSGWVANQSGTLIHETQCANLAIKASGVLGPANFIGGVP